MCLLNTVTYRCGVLFLLSLFLTVWSVSVQCEIKVHSKNSSISLADGAQFIADRPISSFAGTVRDESGGGISGSDISFTGGVLQTDDGAAEISGSWSSDGSVLLSGNQRVVVSNKTPFRALSVRGSGNFLTGSGRFLDSITLQDVNATLTLKLYSTIDQDIELNNGSLYLCNDLAFVDDHCVTGSGICHLDGYSMAFGHDNLSFSETLSWVGSGCVELGSDVTLSGTWVFENESVLCGNGKTLSLVSDGSLIVAHGGVLTLDNIRIKGLGESSGSAGTFNLRCLGSSAKLCMYNSQLSLDDDYSFTVGAIDIDRYAELVGKDYTFSYSSVSELAIKNNSMLKFSKGIIFRYISDSESKTRVTMVDKTSQLYLDGCTLYSTHTGLRLENGTVLVDDDVTLYSEADVPAEALEFDSGLDIRILAGATLDIDGMLLYD